MKKENNQKKKIIKKGRKKTQHTKRQNKNKKWGKMQNIKQAQQYYVYMYAKLYVT